MGDYPHNNRVQGGHISQHAAGQVGTADGRLIPGTPGSSMNRAGFPAAPRHAFWIALFFFLIPGCLGLRNQAVKGFQEFRCYFVLMAV